MEAAGVEAEEGDAEAEDEGEPEAEPRARVGEHRREDEVEDAQPAPVREKVEQPERHQDRPRREQSLEGAVGGERTRRVPVGAQHDGGDAQAD